MKYAVSEEGINAMQSAASAISEAVEEMMSQSPISLEFQLRRDYL